VNGEQTLDASWTYRGQKADKRASPGLLLLFSGTEPQLLPIPLAAGRHVLGREADGGVFVRDPRMSRRHVEVGFESGGWRIRDLESHNGTFLDGVQLTAEKLTREHRVLRIGNTVFGLVSDLRPYRGQLVKVEGKTVLGPTMQARWTEIANAAKENLTLHIVGESGTGKELAARQFHHAGPRAAGPFVAVNCATITPNLAERLLFGTKKGAYSGADAPAEGYLQAADGGTLFLDEIAELEPSVQAKLLRAIENREVLPLGASRPTRVDIAICTGTHQDLRERVGKRLFRSDLLYRIAVSTVRLPPLRERLEDLPWLVHSALRAHGELVAHVSLVEACLCRDWPGNVRELNAELANAVTAARRAGRNRVEASDLTATAGRNLEARTSPPTEDEAILDALREENGNVAGAARRLGMHRTQLRRWMKQHSDNTE
jgi:transcriptional regulator with PAS, ATPase and Fis domain